MLDLPAMALSQRINGERLIVLGWSRAILMQVAHPLIAAGVYHHSGFRASPLAAIARLRATVGAMLALTFGDEPRRSRVIAGIRTIHDRVAGTLSEAVGPFPAGTAYSANDPELLLWVHTTLIETMVLTYELFVGALTSSERDAYCRASAPVPVALGARADAVPERWDDLVDANRRMLASPAIVVGPHARALSTALLEGPMMRVLAPASWLNRLVTAGLLPSLLRSAYGLSWTDRRARTFQRTAGAIKRIRSMTPARAARFAKTGQGPVRSHPQA